MQPKQRPMLFNAQMVRALHAGTKTQTRRVMKPQPTYQGFDHAPRYKGALGEWGYPSQRGFKCPYGQPGDRLWVRETWQGPMYDDIDAYLAEPSDYHKPDYCEYAADGGAPPEFMTLDDELVQRWRPSIHMPRWASRITLEIVGVRVERLQDISRTDAIAEGVELPPLRADEPIADPCSYYRALWESINGPGSWDANPWVWVVEFKRVKP